MIYADKLTFGFSSTILFQDISFQLEENCHCALIGSNGTGKTTILKIINDVLEADAGKITLGSKVSIGYYDQEHHVLHDEKTLFEEISDEDGEIPF